MDRSIKVTTVMMLAVILLSACGNDEETGDAEEFVHSYYTLMENNDFEGVVDHLSDSLLDHMQTDAETLVAEFVQMDLNFEFVIKESNLFDVNEELHASYEEYDIILNSVDEDTDIYRVRTEILYSEQNYEYPGIDDALVAQIDGEWKILGVFSYS